MNKLIPILAFVTNKFFILIISILTLVGTIPYALTAIWVISPLSDAPPPLLGKVATLILACGAAAALFFLLFDYVVNEKFLERFWHKHRLGRVAKQVEKQIREGSRLKEVDIDWGRTEPERGQNRTLPVIDYSLPSEE